jgi:hypothetical protein
MQNDDAPREHAGTLSYEGGIQGLEGFHISNVH